VAFYISALEIFLLTYLLTLINFGIHLSINDFFSSDCTRGMVGLIFSSIVIIALSLLISLLVHSLLRCFLLHYTSSCLAMNVNLNV